MSDQAGLTFVILGASGDLTKRLLFPALHRLMALGRVAPTTRVIGYAMDDLTTDAFVANLHDAVAQFGEGVDDRVWPTVVANTVYVKGDLTPGAVQQLAPLVGGEAVFYLALPPPLFGPAATSLGMAGLAHESSGPRRLVVEKPFGTSSATAAALQQQLRTHWEEPQIFRIDHFLGKETVQNLLVFRLANRFVEAIWNTGNIRQVQITAAETLGLEGRWRYYDQAGALRDMLQNHLMQLFALCAMEPPSLWDGEVLREHKVELLRSVRSVTPDAMASAAVRGQYAAGTSSGAPVIAYRAEDHIAPDSRTETYAALKLFVDHWRWQGVPFYLRSGKRMSSNCTEIALELREPPALLFNDADGIVPSNWIVLRLRPDETIEFDAVAKRPGLGLSTERVTLSTTSRAVGGAEYSAYEQLLLDVIAGDRSLFIRGDEAMEAWRIVQPVLDAWAADGEPTLYPSGSDGPPSPSGFFAPGLGWRPVYKG
jgi:glucose-6-phosphate 1-dehydrogenase